MFVKNVSSENLYNFFDKRAGFTLLINLMNQLIAKLFRKNPHRSLLMRSVFVIRLKPVMN